MAVSPADTNEPARVLNYLTAPHVVIWSAVSCSSAFPFLFMPQDLLARDSHGQLVKYVPSSGVWEGVSFHLELGGSAETATSMTRECRFDEGKWLGVCCGGAAEPYGEVLGQHWPGIRQSGSVCANAEAPLSCNASIAMLNRVVTHWQRRSACTGMPSHVGCALI